MADDIRAGLKLLSAEYIQSNNLEEKFDNDQIKLVSDLISNIYLESLIQSAAVTLLHMKQLKDQVMSSGGTSDQLVEQLITRTEEAVKRAKVERYQAEYEKLAPGITNLHIVPGSLDSN